MRIKNAVIAVFAFYLAACTVVWPTWTYRSPFNPDKIGAVINIMGDIAHKWNLEYSIGDRDQARFLTFGKEAFQVHLFYEGESIVLIGNVGVGEVLSLMVVDHGDMPIEELNQLKTDIINTLDKDAHIKLELYSKPKSDEPYLTF